MLSVFNFCYSLIKGQLQTNQSIKTTGIFRAQLKITVEVTNCLYIKSFQVKKDPIKDHSLSQSDQF